MAGEKVQDLKSRVIGSFRSVRPHSADIKVAGIGTINAANFSEGQRASRFLAIRL